MTSFHETDEGQPDTLAPPTEQQKQWAALKAQAPLRSTAPQHDLDGLTLFDAVRSPSML